MNVVFDCWNAKAKGKRGERREAHRALAVECVEWVICEMIIMRFYAPVFIFEMLVARLFVADVVSYFFLLFLSLIFLYVFVYFFSVRQANWF